MPGIRPSPIMQRRLRPASLKPEPDSIDRFLDACGKGDHEEIRWFLKYYPARQWTVHRGGKTGLMYAAEAGGTGTVQLLLEQGLNIHAKDNAGMTAFLYAAAEGKSEVLQLLAGKGAGIFARDNKRSSAFHFAAKNGDPATLKILLANCGSMLDGRDDAGNTPLVYAVLGGKEEAVRLLLDNSADIKATSGGRTLIELAEERDLAGVADMLRKEPARRRSEISATVKNGLTCEMKVKSTFRVRPAL